MDPDAESLGNGIPITSTVIIDLGADDSIGYSEDGRKYTDNSKLLKEDVTTEFLNISSNADVLISAANPVKQRNSYGKYAHMLPKTEPFICPFKGCGNVSASRLQLRQHYRNHQEKTHACQFCSQKFLYLKDKRSHERSHTGERPYVCQVCKKSFIQKSTLTTHLVTHDKSEKREVCDVCGRAYYHKKSLAKHRKDKHIDHIACEFFLCSLCGRHYLGSKGFNVHLKNCIGKKDAPLQCPSCLRTCTTKHVLKKHLESCGVMTYECGVCEAGFHDERALSAHLRSDHDIAYDACVHVRMRRDDAQHPGPESPHSGTEVPTART